MGTKFTRRRFLMIAAAGATYLALTNTMGCAAAERTSKTTLDMTSRPTQPAGEVAYEPQPAAKRGVWSFRSRPDLSPQSRWPKTTTKNSPPGYVFVAPQRGDSGQGGSLIIDSQALHYPRDAQRK
jgi:hypothetical protein